MGEIVEFVSSESNSADEMVMVGGKRIFPMCEEVSVGKNNRRTRAGLVVLYRVFLL